jgi:Class II flagellar assembly regulator
MIAESPSRSSMIGVASIGRGPNPAAGQIWMEVPRTPEKPPGSPSSAQRVRGQQDRWSLDPPHPPAAGPAGILPRGARCRRVCWTDRRARESNGESLSGDAAGATGWTRSGLPARGSVCEAALGYVGAVRDSPTGADDMKLDAALDAIELRVAVELAKRQYGDVNSEDDRRTCERPGMLRGPHRHATACERGRRWPAPARAAYNWRCAAHVGDQPCLGISNGR